MHELLTRPGSRKHIVQFCPDEESILRSVGTFIGEGLRQGEAIVVLATEEHWSGFLRHLKAQRFDVSPALRSGRLRFLDARETLAKFKVDGQLDWGRFRSVIGTVLSGLLGSGRFEGIRAYGEIVDLLWQEGRVEDVATLEEFWDRILHDHPVTLFCGYRLDLMDGGAAVASLRAALSPHTHLLPSWESERLEEALRRSMDAELGAERAAALRPLIKASISSGTVLPGAEAVVLWLRSNLPALADRILARARTILDGSPAEGAPAVVPPPSPHTVLLVEDDPNDLLLISHAFERSAPEVRLRVARDGEEAIGFLGEVPEGESAPRLVILDLKLPRKSGFEVLEWIRKESPRCDLPVVIHTSSRETQDVDRAHRLGANSFVVKSVDLRTLRELTRGLGAFASLL